MALVTGTVRVSVPATSANLGPGFDALGLALTMRDRLTATLLDGGLEIEVTGAGADEVPRDSSHLVVRCINRALHELGEEPVGLPDSAHGLRLTCDNVIPHSRGLGSSSAAIVAGLALGRALVVGGDLLMNDDALFALAAEIEGHPDNVAPAAYGGFVIAGHEGDTFYAAESAVDPSISAVVFVPSTPVETKVARGLLPATVPHADAAANAGRAALLVAALAGQPSLLLWATRDWLHQDYREPAMPESVALVRALRADGHAAIISGAGPTVLAFAASKGDRQALVARTPEGWVSYPLDVDHEGVVVS
ncbi:homoserine kinase [Nocardioides jiangxiensis]|uniref:Homoserine kinase n=1 Tax=Nocardioides jiangxiensis TaxID=3064524 RepID=A0ABT9B2D9_9ACTN|nr:homoserine kinase [Nocardioides sp. WY-20]MDO7867333.1 homoserine kinase [Nocardioides sp. WY-20]